MDRRKGIRPGYKRLGPTARFVLQLTAVGLLLMIIFFVYQCATTATKKDQIAAQRDRETKHAQEMRALSEVKAILYDKEKNQVTDSNDVKVLSQNIISAKKGYMRIAVSKSYLNTNFDDPLTLRYESGRYQPVAVTFENDAQWGPGVILTSPEHENTAKVYLNQQIRFRGFGKMTWAEDLVFKLYYSDYFRCFVPESGEVRFEHGLPPIRYGRIKCLGYFDEEDQERNRGASKDFEELEAFFKDPINP